jgi:hypothetical protein
MLIGPMSRHRPAVRRLLGLLVTMVALASPSAAAAVDAIPAEPGTTVLERGAITAIVADVDGDGVRELVRLVPRTGNPAEVAVDVVRMEGDEPAVYAEAGLRRVADVDEQTGGGPLVIDGMLPVRIDDPARLLVWRERGAERVLAVGIGLPEGRAPCCLTAWRVTLDRLGVSLEPLPGTVGSALFVRTADLDGDGTDELVVTEPTDIGQPDALPISVYRWDGDQFERKRRSLAPAGPGPLVPVGNSDGLPGDELGLIGLGAEDILHRIAMDTAGALRVESAGLPFLGDVIGIDGPDGPRLVLASGVTGTELLSWPAGAAAFTAEAVSIRRGAPMAVLGDGDDARLVLLGAEGTLDVLGPNLASRQGVVGLEASASFRGSTQVPYVGSVPGGVDGDAAFIFRGRMLTPVPRPDARVLELLEERRVASLPGVVPIGAFGAGQAWMALAADTAFDATRDGGQLGEAAGPSRGAATTVAPRELVLGDERDGGTLAPPLIGAVRSQRQPARPILLARDAFRMEIGGPPGTRVTLFVNEAAEAQQEIDAGGALVVDVPVPGDGDGNRQFMLRLLAVTPAGHGYGALWEVQIRRQEPSLEVTAATAALSLSVPVTGMTEPGMRVVVDGEEVPVAADGGFATEVPGGLLPRLVRVEVSDPLGNRAEASLSVVGLVDYRRWPWIPIVVVLTLVAAATLYLRAPRPAPPSPRRPEDGTLEELD